MRRSCAASRIILKPPPTLPHHWASGGQPAYAVPVLECSGMRKENHLPQQQTMLSSHLLATLAPIRSPKTLDPSLWRLNSVLGLHLPRYSQLFGLSGKQTTIAAASENEIRTQHLQAIAPVPPPCLDNYRMHHALTSTNRMLRIDPIPSCSRRWRRLGLRGWQEERSKVQRPRYLAGKERAESTLRRGETETVRGRSPRNKASKHPRQDALTRSSNWYSAASCPALRRLALRNPHLWVVQVNSRPLFAHSQEESQQRCLKSQA